MYLRSSFAVLLLVVICAASPDGGISAEESSNVDFSLESEIINSSVFRQTKNCLSDGDCLHLSKCETTENGKFCNCKNGTSGDFCETLDDCADELEMCGTSADVSCVFDNELEKAVCKCDNDTKTYVPDEERCMSPCTNYDQCGRYGYCYNEFGNQTFCSCKLGAIGDYCEIIEWCHTKKVDCGNDNNATCTLGGKGKAYCKCDDSDLGFDYDEKVCKDCSGCGKHLVGAGGCIYKEGKRICSCDLGYYSSEEGKCEDCKCGDDGYRCSFPNGTKLCKCYSGSSQKGEICEKCDCGAGESKCEFVENKKLCTCKEGYAAAEEEEGKCKEVCNDTKPCQNGGECVQNFCKCLNGTRGDLCETVEYCTYHKCRYDSDCVYNVTSQKGSCECQNSEEIFDESSNFCRKCDCGTGAQSCSYVYGRKNCTCNVDYAEVYGTCEPCYCTNQTSSPACYFKYYNKVCQCDEGYAQRGSDCIKCDCGENGKCTYSTWGQKECECNEGYKDYKGICKECDCGEKGYCKFDSEGNKTCSCSYGYQEYEGTCLECDCGENSNCKLLGWRMIQCTCRSGYARQYGRCVACDCYPGNDCWFETGFYKRCICPKGYADYRETCKECDCKADGANCSYVSSGINKCQCPKGYEEVPHSSISLQSYCKDVDECKQHDVCPSSTECVNTVGSYDCVCRDGYEEYDLYDIKKDGCRDINECVRKWRPCTDSYANCVNTPGSYQCVCQSGYTLLSAYKQESNICIVDARPWRTATIVVGILSGVTIIVLLLIILVRRNRQ